MPTPSDALQQPLTELLLSIADDKLMLGHRNADWTGLAPILEEDIAFSSLAQDDIAHAQALYEFIARRTGDEPNRLAFGRAAAEYRCCALVELADEFDWAAALVRQFFCDHFEMLRLGRLGRSSDAPLAELVRRLLAEERLSVGHADQWVVRLGKANIESRDRVQRAVDRLAPLAATLFEPTPGVEALEAAGVYPPGVGEMFTLWHSAVETVLSEAGLSIALERWPAGRVGGRRGRHSDGFAALLDEMCEVYRVEPQAQW